MLLHLLRRGGAGGVRLLSSYPPHRKVTLPALSPTMAEGGLARWNKLEGESITIGQVLCEVETDKATLDFEFQDDDAFLAKRLVPEKQTGIKVGSVIAILVDDKQDVAKFATSTFEEFNSVPEVVAPVAAVPAAAPAPPKAAAPAPVAAAAPKDTSVGGGRVIASPLARKLARELGYDLASVTGTGPNGRIVAHDVREFTPSASEPEAAAPAPATPQDWAFNKHVAPHFYLNVDVDFTEALSVRARLNDSQGSTTPAISVNDLVLRAAVLSMKRVPECNAAWLDSAIRVFHNVDVNVAQVQGEHDSSVAYPCLPNLHLAGLAGIAAAVPVPHQQGTFSLVNVGAYGVKSIVPVVRPGQSCALGVGALSQVLVPSASAGGGAQVRTVGTVTLSCDHRIVDGAVGAQWLQHFKSLVETPLNMLL